MAMRPRYRLAFIDQSIPFGNMRLPWGERQGEGLSHTRLRSRAEDHVIQGEIDVGFVLTVGEKIMLVGVL